MEDNTPYTYIIPLRCGDLVYADTQQHAIQAVTDAGYVWPDDVRLNANR